MSAPKYLGTLGENQQVKLGSELIPSDQKYVLAAYVHRYTREHVPAWKTRGDCVGCPVQFATDADWLANTFFAVTNNGCIALCRSSCESHPTWPDGRVGVPIDPPYSTSAR